MAVDCGFSCVTNWLLYPLTVSVQPGKMEVQRKAIRQAISYKHLNFDGELCLFSFYCDIQDINTKLGPFF
jgi:hypothetical protein